MAPRTRFRPALLAILAATLAASASCTTQKEGAYARAITRMQKAEMVGSEPIPVDAKDFRGTSLEAMRASTPSDTGGAALRDQGIIDIAITDALSEYGIPGAVEFHSSRDLRKRWFILYYPAPPRTLVFEQTRADVRVLASEQRYRSRLIAELQLVPRSAEILGFASAPLPPPWPDTIGPSMHSTFDVPIRPLPPPQVVNGSGFDAVSGELGNLVNPAGPGPARHRARDAFARLVGVAQLPGVNWKLIVFESTQPLGFSLDDGSIFVSTGIMEKLDDTQAACVIAHLMGHVRYQHAAQAWQRYDLWVAQQTVAGVTGSIAGIVTAPLAAYAPTIEPLPERAAAPGDARLASAYFMKTLINPMSGYTRTQENEANSAAAQYLGDLKIPPDALFYAMLGGSPRPYVAAPGSVRFADLHHLDWSVPDLARMLDAGFLAEP